MAYFCETSDKTTIASEFGWLQARIIIIKMICQDDNHINFHLIFTYFYIFIHWRIHHNSLHIKIPFLHIGAFCIFVRCINISCNTHNNVWQFFTDYLRLKNDGNFNRYVIFMQNMLIKYFALLSSFVSYYLTWLK